LESYSGMDMNTGKGIRTVSAPKTAKSGKYGSTNKIPIISNKIEPYIKAIEMAYGKDAVNTYAAEINVVRGAIDSAKTPNMPQLPAASAVFPQAGFPQAAQPTRQTPIRQSPTRVPGTNYAPVPQYTNAVPGANLAPVPQFRNGVPQLVSPRPQTGFLNQPNNGVPIPTMGGVNYPQLPSLAGL